MTDISTIIDIQVEKNTQVASRASLNFPLVLSAFPSTIEDPERVYTFTSLQEAVEAGFDSTTEVHKALYSIFRQPVVPTQVFVGEKKSAETWPQALAAVQAIEDDWYVLIATTHAKADQGLLAAAIETQRKIYVTSTDDVTATAATTTDIGAALQADGITRTAVIYSTDAANYPEAGWASRQLQEVAGSNDWCYKEIVGANPDKLSSTVSNRLHSKGYTTYERLDGLNRTVGGNMANGDPIDEVVLIDWYVIELRADLWTLVATTKKIPYTDQGIAQIDATIRAVNARGVTNGGFAASPAPSVIVPTVASVLPIDKQQRRLRNVVVTLTLAGSIRTIQIRASVNL